MELGFQASQEVRNDKKAKKRTQVDLGNVTQLVEYLPGMHEVLGSSPRMV